MACGTNVIPTQHPSSHRHICHSMKTLDRSKIGRNIFEFWLSCAHLPYAITQNTLFVFSVALCFRMFRKCVKILELLALPVLFSALSLVLIHSRSARDAGIWQHSVLVGGTLGAQAQACCCCSHMEHQHTVSSVVPVGTAVVCNAFLMHSTCFLFWFLFLTIPPFFCVCSNVQRWIYLVHMYSALRAILYSTLAVQAPGQDGRGANEILFLLGCAFLSNKFLHTLMCQNMNTW